MDTARQIPDLMSTGGKHLVVDLMRHMGQRLRQFIRKRVASEAEAEDILQDVWQQSLATLEEGPIEQLAAWLYTVARHRIIDRYRKRKVTSLEGLAEAEEGLELAALLPTDESEASESWRAMFWMDLHAALAELPEAQRQVFITPTRASAPLFRITGVSSRRCAGPGAICGTMREE